MDRRKFNQSLLGAGMLASFTAELAAAEAVRAISKVTSDIEAATRTGTRTTLSKAQVKEFQSSLRGSLLMPGNDGYESARQVWNGMINKHPALIARCEGAADVLTAVSFARSNDLLVAVRGGGHSISGKSVCEGGLVIDLSPMRWARVNPVTRIARLGSGSLLGDLDKESQYFGLATPAGTVSHTGAAGLTLGGGHGRLSRRFGLTCDNVRSVDLVMADASLVRASAAQNPDLYWGIRGGGGNFGVVTSFEYNLHKVGPTVLGGTLMYPLSQAREVLGFYSDFAETAPRELSVDVIMLAPPGRKAILILSICYTGTFSEGERILQPLRTFRKPMVDQVAPTSYIKMQTSADKGTPAGKLYYNKSGLMKKLEPGAIDKLVERMESASGQADPEVASNIIIQHLGGAVADLAPGDTAYAHRDARHDVLILSGWTNPDYSEQNIAWLRESYAAIQQYTIGFYSNHMVDSDESMESRTYRGNYDRLVLLKNKFDPTNLFHLNANIKPT
jgi:FAD/FMN-containing dehydrogenase